MITPETTPTSIPTNSATAPAASLKDFVPDTLLPGISINTSPTDFAPIKQLRLMRFKGEKWELFGDIISSNLSN